MYLKPIRAPDIVSIRQLDSRCVVSIRNRAGKEVDVEVGKARANRLYRKMLAADVSEYLAHDGRKDGQIGEFFSKLSEHDLKVRYLGNENGVRNALKNSYVKATGKMISGFLLATLANANIFGGVVWLMEKATGAGAFLNRMLGVRADAVNPDLDEMAFGAILTAIGIIGIAGGAFDLFANWRLAKKTEKAFAAAEIPLDGMEKSGTGNGTQGTDSWMQENGNTKPS